MADFSTNDINEAKRRVQEMRDRARELVIDEPRITSTPNPQPEPSNNSISDLLGGLFSSSDSSLILALVLILSHEKADNMLILALLYILL